MRPISRMVNHNLYRIISVCLIFILLLLQYFRRIKTIIHIRIHERYVLVKIPKLVFQNAKPIEHKIVVNNVKEKINNFSGNRYLFIICFTNSILLLLVVHLMAYR